MVFAEHGVEIVKRDEVVYKKVSVWRGEEVEEKYYPVKF